MSEQPDLFGTPEAPSNPLEAAFWKFHAENPHVYRLFCDFTDRAIRRGYERLSADMIMHRIRWETSIETTEAYAPPGEDALKLNNNHVAYYARLWMRDHPAHDGFFRLRILQNGDVSGRLAA